MSDGSTDGIPSLRPAVPAELARSWMLRSPLATLDATPCDALVIDLEDGLPAAHKDLGRAAALRFLQRSAAWVRVNAVGTPEWADDLAMVASAPKLSGVMLAVTESAGHVGATAAWLAPGTRIVALIESAIGLESAASIATHPSTFRLAFGSGDFRSDTGMADDTIALSWPRARLVVASAAAKIAAPIDGPTLGDDISVLAASRHAASMGMTGKLVLSPAQASVIERGLSPASDTIADALSLLSRTPDDSADGSYAPAVARAERVIDRARAFGLLDLVGAQAGSR